ncbi:MAG: glycosyltransferase family 2 protein, partial [Acidobacteriota bacterium]
MTALWLTDPGFPTVLGDLLLAGTVGRDHLLRAAALAGAAARTAPPAEQGQYARRQALLLAAAWEEDPLYAPTAQALLAVQPALPPGSLDPAFVALAAALAGRFAVPESTAYFERLLASGDAARLTRYLENEIRCGRHGLFWLHVALRRAVLARDFDQAAALAGSALTEALLPLGEKVAGDLALLAERPHEALERYQAVQAKAPWPAGLFRPALAALAQNDAARARERLSALLRAMPEHVSVLLALSDLVSGRFQSVSRLPGSLAVALYTYNKAADLDRTLASLFASDLSVCDG